MQAVSVGAGAPRRLRVRLAVGIADVRAAQALRFSIFYQEMGAKPSIENQILGLDVDPFDTLCDHLLVEDVISGEPVVVGTYRLLRQSIATARSGFYSASEYDLSRLVATVEGTGCELLELGRSCVAPAYRDSGTIQLLWRGIAQYLNQHSIGYLIGCASFPGIDVDTHAAALSYLYHHHLAPQPLRAHALPGVHVEMAQLPIGGYDQRLAMRTLPPLIKGYLRAGAMIGDGAFIDTDFNTIDVFMIMPVAQVSARYGARFAVA